MSTSPAEFLSRAGFTCETWLRYNRQNRLVEATIFATQGRTTREGGVHPTRWQEEHGGSQSEYNAMWAAGTAFLNRVDAYCLQQAVIAQNTPKQTPRYTRLRPAGEASPTPQGAQWLGLAFIGAAFGFFYWGMRKETPEEIAAYNAMRAARHNPGHYREPKFAVRITSGAGREQAMYVAMARHRYSTDLRSRARTWPSREEAIEWARANWNLYANRPEEFTFETTEL